MNQSQIILLSTFSTFSVLIPIVLGIAHGVYKEKNILPIFYLQCITLFVEIINYILVLNNKNNMMVFNGFTLVEFIFIIIFFKTFFDQFQKKTVHILILSVFALLVIYTGFISKDLKLIDNLSVSIESIILIVYSLISFFVIMKNLVYDNLLSTPFFWINSAILIYFSGNLFFFAFSTFLQKYNDQKLYLQLSIIHSIFNILYYITISIGFWKARKV